MRPPPPAGTRHLLLLTGGDDQALALTLLQLGQRPPSTSARDGGGSSSSDSGGVQCREVLRLAVPCAHASAVRAVWLGAPQPAPAAAAAGAAVLVEHGRQPAWSATAFSLGLDQQLRRWRLRVGPCGQQLEADGGSGPGLGLAQGAGAARYCTSSAEGSSPGWQLEAVEAGCRFTQVVEPWALDVLADDGTSRVDGSDSGGSGARRYLLAVAGRGTEVLTWCV